MLKEHASGVDGVVPYRILSRVTSAVAKSVCETANISVRANPKRIGRQEADSLYQAIQNTRISPPATDCLVAIGEELILKGLHQVVPGEFYCAATRPPSVYRGNPFLIEVGLAYGGAKPGAEGLAGNADGNAVGERFADAPPVPRHQFRWDWRPGGGSNHARVGKWGRGRVPGRWPRPISSGSTPRCGTSI
jgi:hypothetical protein